MRDLKRIAELLDVEHTECFAPLGGLTHCNSYARLFCAAAGLWLPPLLANDQHDWLSDPGHGWCSVGAVAAASESNAGRVVLASWRNPSAGHGHIAVVMPGSAPGALLVSAAGAERLRCAAIERSFGVTIFPDFFAEP